MTVRELIRALENFSADAEARIEAFGGMREGKPVDKVTTGFDWDAGCVILHPAVPLAVVPPKNRPLMYPSHPDLGRPPLRRKAPE